MAMQTNCQGLQGKALHQALWNAAVFQSLALWLPKEFKSVPHVLNAIVFIRWAWHLITKTIFHINSLSLGMAKGLDPTHLPHTLGICFSLMRQSPSQCQRYSRRDNRSANTVSRGSPSLGNDGFSSWGQAATVSAASFSPSSRHSVDSNRLHGCNELGKLGNFSIQ